MKTFRKTFRKSFIKNKLLGKASAKKHLGKVSAKAQSAMEYLMTYGWAILIISVVLAALFQLGVFNPMTFAPKALPGSCQVFRPNGPGTTSFINLEGICSGELPQYVAQLSSGYIQLNTVPVDFLPSYTINFWIYPTRSNENIFHMYSGMKEAAPGCPMFVIGISPLTVASWNLNYPNNWYASSFNSINPSLNTWSMISITLSGGGVGTGTMTAYINGGSPDSTKGQETYSGTLYSDPGSVIGVSGSGCPGAIGDGGFSGDVANFQIYNTTLSSSEIQALYQEGIGGAPIDLQHLVGWWPLNGNANDYSGNGNNGQASNVIYVSNWYSGYTPP